MSAELQSDPLRLGIEGALAASADLLELLPAGRDSIFYRRGDQDAERPLVIFHRQASTEEWTFGNRRQDATTDDLWTVKAVADRAQVAETLNRLIRAALDGAALELGDDTRQLLCRYESAVDFGESDGAATIHHVGGLYRLVTQTT